MVEHNNSMGIARVVLGAVEAAEVDFDGLVADQLLSTLDDGGIASLGVVRGRGSWTPEGETLKTARLSAPIRSAQFHPTFNTVNPRSVEWASRRSAALIREVSAETRAGVRAMIAAGMVEGIPPRRLINLIVRTVGLRTDQVRAAVNLSARLAAAKPGQIVKAGALKLKVPKSGASKSWISARQRQYMARLRRQRALLIGRTETMHSANEGQRQLWLQSRDRGDLPSSAKREWIVTPDERLREKHAAMIGQVVGIEESFVDPEGGEIEPGEEPHCRCGQGIASDASVARSQSQLHVGRETKRLVGDAAMTGKQLGPADIFNSLRRSEQKKINGYIERAAANEAEYKTIIESAAKRLKMTTGDFLDPQPGKYFFGPLKQADRIAEKAIIDYKGALNEVSDVLRMTYMVRDPDDAMRLYRLLDDIDDPVGLKNRMLEPGMGGYRDVIFKVTLKDGMRAEVQINTRSMLVAKEGPGHKIYERMRVLRDDSAEWAALNKESEELYGRAWAEVCREFPQFAGCKAITVGGESYRHAASAPLYYLKESDILYRREDGDPVRMPDQVLWPTGWAPLIGQLSISPYAHPHLLPEGQPTAVLTRYYSPSCRASQWTKRSA